jgi:hypothetical protein
MDGSVTDNLEEDVAEIIVCTKNQEEIFASTMTLYCTYEGDRHTLGDQDRYAFRTREVGGETTTHLINSVSRWLQIDIKIRISYMIFKFKIEIQASDAYYKEQEYEALDRGKLARLRVVWHTSEYGCVSVHDIELFSLEEYN